MPIWCCSCLISSTKVQNVQWPECCKQLYWTSSELTRSPMLIQNTGLLVGSEKERCEVKVALSNSFGFGGHNSSILFAPYKWTCMIKELTFLVVQILHGAKTTYRRLGLWSWSLKGKCHAAATLSKPRKQAHSPCSFTIANIWCQKDVAVNGPVPFRFTVVRSIIP
jgi:hypothetical protein